MADKGTLPPTGKIAPQDWMIAAETRAVFRALEEAGGEARFVGGCVRDALLKRPVTDIDLATTLPPAEVSKALAAGGFKVIPTGIKHGTVTAIKGGRQFEITTLRRDTEADGRHARVRYSDDWEEDAARRDFMINTLSANLEGDVYDVFGALGDIAYAKVRFVGNAAQRIDEDVLRLLRFFRFQAYYGKPPPDREALSACRSRAAKLPSLSGERVRDELLKILLAPDPAAVCHLMAGEHVFRYILPEASKDVGRLRLLNWLETQAIRFDSVAPDALRRLAALLDTDAEGVAAVARRLRLSNKQRHRLVKLAAPAWRPVPELAADTLRRAFHRLGPGAVRDLVLLEWAGRAAVTPRLPAGETDAWQAMIAAAEEWTPVELPVRGRDVVACGIKEGPAVAKLLSAIEAWWEDGAYRAGREECLARLKELAGEQEKEQKG